jgi:hypothetical protein
MRETCKRRSERRSNAPPSGTRLARDVMFSGEGCCRPSADRGTIGHNPTQLPQNPYFTGSRRKNVPNRKIDRKIDFPIDS